MDKGGFYSPDCRYICAGKTLLIYGIIMILLGLVSVFWLKETTQEVGLYPDNDPEYAGTKKAVEFVSKWTFAKLLWNKNAYLITFSFGLSFLVCLILVFVEVQPVVAVFLVFVVGLNGAPGNLTPSMFITKFGA